jgi:homogentisate 1,2-dioxygenase
MLDRLTAGEVALKPHTALYDAQQNLRYEECLTRRGFDGPYTILYHEHRPHELLPAECKHGWSDVWSDEAALQPALLARHHYCGRALPRPTTALAPIDARVPLLLNEEVIISLLQPTASDPVYFSNADGDDLYFIHSGAGVLRSAFGDLSFDAGDYLCIPKGVLHRFELTTGVAQIWLSIECRADFGLLKQARNELGQLRMDAPYCHRDFKRPRFVGPNDEGLRESVVKRANRFQGFTHRHSPLDVIGFDGTVYPWAFPISKFQPRVGATHLPPTVHGTFQCRGALICSFVPRPLDFAQSAVTCPYPHSSVDVDEVIYYVSGQFSSRVGVESGSLTHHPAGMPHGPHPGAYEHSVGVKATDEVAVMLDCYNPLRATALCRSIEDATYEASFCA